MNTNNNIKYIQEIEDIDSGGLGTVAQKVCECIRGAVCKCFGRQPSIPGSPETNLPISHYDINLLKIYIAFKTRYKN